MTYVLFSGALYVLEERERESPLPFRQVVL